MGWAERSVRVRVSLPGLGDFSLPTPCGCGGVSWSGYVCTCVCACVCKRGGTVYLCGVLASVLSPGLGPNIGTLSTWAPTPRCPEASVVGVSSFLKK